MCSTTSRMRGGRGVEHAKEVPIELLTAGDLVYSHDGQPHQILDTVRRQYSGLMFEVHAEDGKSLCVTEDLLLLADGRVKRLAPSGGWTAIPKHHFARARRLRQAMSPPELALWCELRGGRLGVKFRKQHPLGPYIVDFYCHECGLVVEVDGVQHFLSEEERDYDRRRDEFMNALGLFVLRFSACEVGANLEGVLRTVYRAATQRTLQSDPSRQWHLPEGLRPGDLQHSAPASSPKRVIRIDAARRAEDIVELSVTGTHTCLTALCAVHTCWP